MAAARLAAALAFALPLAGAQQSSTGFVASVVVTDPTGAPLNGALVDMGDGCSDPIGGETNEQGLLNFELSPGAHYHLAATFPGFCPAAKVIEPVSQPVLTIPIQLAAGACPNSCAPPCTAADPPLPAKSTQARLVIQVTDVRGLAIPEARIETDPSSDPPGPVLGADGNGLASIKLPPGTHIFSITAPGFDPWAHQLDLQAASSRTIAAALQKGTACEPSVITTRTEQDVPLSTPEEVLISLEPLQGLAPLPERDAKKHW